jgi:hypothetical protein
MNGDGSLEPLLWLGLLFALSPLWVLVHELGHAAVALVRTEGVVRVRVGRMPGRWRRRIGRLVLSIDPRPVTGVGGGTLSTARLGAGERVAFSLAGPIAQLLPAVVLVAAGLRLPGILLAASAAWNLVPRRTETHCSDGWHLLEALRGRPTPHTETQDTAARAQLLFERPDVHLHPRNALLAPAANGDAMLLRAAYAGWCWRSAQRVGLGDTRGAALDALHAATVTGLVEPHLTIDATRRLAASLADFGDLFVAGMSSSVAGPAQITAFRYGGALHDIERIRG